MLAILIALAFVYLLFDEVKSPSDKRGGIVISVVALLIIGYVIGAFVNLAVFSLWPEEEVLVDTVLVVRDDVSENFAVSDGANFTYFTRDNQGTVQPHEVEGKYTTVYGCPEPELRIFDNQHKTLVGRVLGYVPVFNMFQYQFCLPQ